MNKSLDLVNKCEETMLKNIDKKIAENKTLAKVCNSSFYLSENAGLEIAKCEIIAQFNKLVLELLEKCGH